MPKVMTSASESSSLPKSLAGVGQARDAAIEGVKWNGKQDGDRRPVQMHMRLAASVDGRDGLGHGEVAGPKAPGGE